MFKGAETRFLKGIILGFLLMSGLTGKGVFHVHGSYDLDKDGLVETLILNTRASSAIWVEISKSSIADTIWTYLLPNGQKFNDAEVVDLNNDGYHDLVAVVEMVAPGTLLQKGFLKQEGIPFDKFLKTQTGSLFL